MAKLVFLGCNSESQYDIMKHDMMKPELPPALTSERSTHLKPRTNTLSDTSLPGVTFNCLCFNTYLNSCRRQSYGLSWLQVAMPGKMFKLSVEASGFRLLSFDSS